MHWRPGFTPRHRGWLWQPVPISGCSCKSATEQGKEGEGNEVDFLSQSMGQRVVKIAVNVEGVWELKAV